LKRFPESIKDINAVQPKDPHFVFAPSCVLMSVVLNRSKAAGNHKGKGKGKGKGKVVSVLFSLTEHHAMKAYWGVEV
jgi:hypothetical protein